MRNPGFVFNLGLPEERSWPHACACFLTHEPTLGPNPIQPGAQTNWSVLDFWVSAKFAFPDLQIIFRPKICMTWRRNQRASSHISHADSLLLVIAANCASFQQWLLHWFAWSSKTNSLWLFLMIITHLTHKKIKILLANDCNSKSNTAKINHSLLEFTNWAVD